MTRNKDTEYNNDHNNNNNNSSSSNNYNKFERKISRLFDDFLNDVGFTRTHTKFRGGDDGKNSSWSPAIDIKEVDREYLVIADVPGVRKDDIDIELHESVLILSGHLNQDIYSSPQAQEINIGKDNHQHPTHQPNQYPPPQQYQQQPPQPYQQTTEPQPFQQTQQQPQQQLQQQPQQQLQQQPQQSTEPQKYQQQPSAAQQYQQAVDQKYNLNEPQQQSSHPQQYQQQSNDPHYKQQSNDPNYQQQSNDPNYQQQSNQQQSNDPHYQQQTNEYQHIKHRRQHDPSRNDKFHIQERPYGYFSRSIQLPTNIKSDDEFFATLENGVLKIRIPKNNDKPKRKITIK